MGLTPQNKSGTRAELVEYIKDMAEGWGHLGEPGKAAAWGQGASDLESGASTVTLGACVYKVDEGDDTGGTA